MFEKIWKKIVRRPRFSLWALAALLLWFVSFFYRLGAAVARAWQRRHRVKLALPVISVGNITVGGTGKTPLVELLARFLTEEGLRVGIVCSGYGRQSRESIVAPGYKIQQRQTLDTGDEVMLLAYQLPETVFSVGPTKAAAAVELARSGKVDLIIVDDGFQHHQLHRDLDIVAFDAAVKSRSLKMFPYGLLREPLRSLRRADVIIVTRAKFARDMPALKGRLSRLSPGAALYSAAFEAEEIVGREASYSVKYLEDKSVFLFAGVGHFRTLEKQVSALCPDIDYALELSDHQVYDRGVLERIKALTDSHDSDVMLTTFKDWVKIGDFDFGREIYYLAQSIDLDPGEEKLIEHITVRLHLRG